MPIYLLKVLNYRFNYILVLEVKKSNLILDKKIYILDKDI
jgi:hypothetical protein